MMGWIKQNLQRDILYSQNSNGRRIHTNAYPIALHSLRFNSARTNIDVGFSLCEIKDNDDVKVNPFGPLCSRRNFVLPSTHSSIKAIPSHVKMSIFDFQI